MEGMMVSRGPWDDRWPHQYNLVGFVIILGLWDRTAKKLQIVAYLLALLGNA